MVQANQHNNANIHHDPLYQHPQLQAASQAWWESVMMDCDHFFEISAQFRLDDSPRNQAALLIELNMTYMNVKMAACPRQTRKAHNMLLSAMSDLMSGFALSLKGEHYQTSDYVQRAQNKLAHFNTLLDELGVH